ncbi:MAG: hypothetical protein KAQ87_01405 [Candidatus Pacebacteria bacterium]|nr:hypothetical protein [Candidatus Paceibacterota bacterium]
MENFNPNKLDQNDKDWIEEVSDDWQKYLDRWLLDYKNGILEKQDIINVIEKIIKYKLK